MQLRNNVFKQFHRFVIVLYLQGIITLVFPTQCSATKWQSNHSQCKWITICFGYQLWIKLGKVPAPTSTGIRLKQLQGRFFGYIQDLILYWHIRFIIYSGTDYSLLTCLSLRPSLCSTYIAVSPHYLNYSASTTYLYLPYPVTDRLICNSYKFI